MSATSSGSESAAALRGGAPEQAEPQARKRSFWPPLWLQIVLALVAGATLGALAGTEPIAFGIGVEQLGKLGMLVIRALKALAVPLVAVVVLDSLLHFDLQGRQGWRLLRICGVNAAVAMTIGIVIIDTLRPGDHLRPLFEPVIGDAWRKAVTHGGGTSLSGLAAFDALIPESVAQPFVNNTVLGAALLALLLGAALRRVRARADAPDCDPQLNASIQNGYLAVRDGIRVLVEALQQALGWIVLLTPLAAFGLVAQAVGKAGLHALLGLWAFLFAIVLGFVLHGLIYYPLMAWLRGGKPPRVYLGGARDALVTGIATNSSLATMPVTLRCLTERMNVSPASARLSACLGTNLNNDGIALYEAMAVLAIAQACGAQLGLAQQLSVVAASVLAGAGIAGIPEAGIVMLPTVLAAVGLPEAAAAAAVPLVMPVDWILARARTAMNVLSDMLVAVLLDRE